MSRLRQILVITGCALAVVGISRLGTGVDIGPAYRVDASKFRAESGEAWRVSIEKIATADDPRGRISIEENETPLARVSSDEVRVGRRGAFLVTKKNVRFIASDGSDPRTNGKRYTVRVSRPHLGLAWVMLIGGLTLGIAGIGRAGWAKFVASASRTGLAVREGRIFNWLRGDEMPLSYAMVRMVAGFTIWWLRPIPVDAKTFFSAHDPATYDPVGPFCFLCPSEPSALLIDACRIVLPLASLCLCAGFLTRLSLIVTILSLWVMASSAWIYGFICHGHTPFLLALLPLLAGRCDALSIDGLLRKVLNRPARLPSGTRAAVLGVQAMAGIVFLSASLHKIYLGNGQFLRWIFSDSLHNLVLSQFVVLRAEVPAWLQWCMERPWLYRSMAAGTVLCQALPFIGIFFVRRPLLRLLCGLAIVIEVHSLDVVMGLFPQKFVLLALVFVDWEYFTRGLKLGPALRAQPGEKSRWRASYAVGVIAFEAIAAVSWFNVRCLYPFTSFPMFSTVYARQPLDRHLPWVLPKSTWRVQSKPPFTEQQLRQLWLGGNELPWSMSGNSNLAAREVAASIKGILQAETGSSNLESFQINAAMFEVQPAPRTDVLLKQEAKFCEWNDGRIRTLPYHLRTHDGTLSLEFAPDGFEPAELRLAYVTLDDWQTHRLPEPIARETRKLSLSFVAHDADAKLTGDAMHVPYPREAGTWVVFVSRDAEGKEEIWSGPRLDQ